MQPADIVFAIDSSGSMDEEAKWVQQQMNTFSQQIVAAKVDVRVVLLSAYPADENGICIDPPLGSGGCPTKDTNLPVFLHVNREVGSHDALQQFVSAYPQYRASMRGGATKHFVVVTDDESDVNAATFTRNLVALDPATLTGFKFHGIFSFTPGDNDHCDGFSAGEGKIYKELVAQTGGVSGDLCLQDFKPVFERLAKAVISGSKLSCEWQIPPPPPGKTFTPSQTNVSYGTAGTSTRRQIPWVDSASACAAAKDGWAWYYDDNVRPTKIMVCPQACTGIQADVSAKIDIAFGCPTVIVPK
ncbi:MAG: vWA domain-containing protein [Polyangiaceae bacterium]